MNSVNMIPQYDTKLMTEIWDSAEDFVADYNDVGIPTTITDAHATTLYYLLYARYGNNPIANYDETQFKYKVFSVIFQYGPTWEKRFAVQETLRGLQLSDLIDDGQLSELFSSQGSNSQTASGTSGNTRTLNTQEANTGTQTVVHSGTSATAHTGKDTVDSTGTQAVARTGTDTTESTGTQALARTGTDTVASTGTSALAHSGTVSNSGETEDIKNHAFNPGTAPAANAYSPLAYINEQHATKNDVDNTTTYNNTDTTTNNLQNQTTHATTDTTTNNLQNEVTHDTTDTTTNNLKNETTRNTTDTTTNNLQDQTTNNLTKADTGTITDSGTTSNTTSGTDSKSNSLTRTLTTGKLKAYEKLLELLDSDVTGEFISKFKICFKQFVIPEKTWIYVTEEE